MKVLFINNDGGGFADTIDIRDGITIGELFLERMHGCAPSDYLIRVNRQPSIPSQALHEGDRITITPTKIQGA